MSGSRLAAPKLRAKAGSSPLHQFALPGLPPGHSNVTAMRNGAAVMVIFETKSKLTIS
jgi:hypothetical protein